MRYILLLFFLYIPLLSGARTLYNDPALTPNDPTDKVMYKATLAVANSTSIPYTNSNQEKLLLLSVTTTNCSSCNTQCNVNIIAANGSDIYWGATGVLTSNTTQHVIFGNGSATASSGLTQAGRTEIPSRFTVQCGNTVGTVDVTVIGYSY